jgi:competence protein ComEA
MWKKIAGVLLAMGFAGLTWAQPIDLNKATEVELDALKGVGPVLTKALMNERKKAPFKDWEDVTSRVKGMGPQKALSLSEQGVRVQGSAYTAKSAGTAGEKKPAKAAEAAKDAAGKAKDAPKDSSKATPKSADATAGKAPPAKN